MKNTVFLFILFVFGILCNSCSKDSSTNLDSGSSGNNGASIALKSYRSSTNYKSEKRAYCTVLVTDNKGNPLPNKRVDWEIIKGEGSLSYQTTVTRESSDGYGEGTTENTVYDVTSDELQLQATVFSYDASVIITFTEFPQL